ncbi:hypothetical protein CRG98_005372 [Punica granatum]|uniref:Uncharacterized protein n=1 Tax=Punica granatum TaxID=22663 RepID=A0A2I0L0J6_PUNGR|nr:hypothetical protein CRG98_005372 [Punica granatum]
MGKVNNRDDLGCQSSKLIDKQYRDDLGYAGCKRSTVGMISAVKVVNSRDDLGCQSSKLIDKQYRDDLGYAGCKRSTVGMISAVKVVNNRDDPGCQSSKLIDKQYRDDLGYAGCKRSTVGMISAVKVEAQVVLSTREARDDPIVAQEAQDDPMVVQEARDDPIFASKCGCKAAVLRLGLTLENATHLVAWESENREWFTRRGCTELLGRCAQLPTLLEEVTHLGAAPLNLKGMSSPFAITAPKGVVSAAPPFVGVCCFFWIGGAGALVDVGIALFRLLLRFVLCPMSLFETPQLCTAEAALWLVVDAWCDVSDHLLLFFAIRASWMVHAAEVTRCSRKTVASMLSDSLDCSRLQLHRGYLIVGHLPRQSIRNGSETSSRGCVN